MFYYAAEGLNFLYIASIYLRLKRVKTSSKIAFVSRLLSRSCKTVF